MGNESLKVLENSLNFLFLKGYEPCIVEPILGISTQSNCPNKKEEVGYTLN